MGFLIQIKETRQLNAITNLMLDSILTGKEMLYKGHNWVNNKIGIKMVG